MSAVATAIVGGAVIGGVMSGNAQKDSAQTAADAQNSSTAASIAQQNKQFEAMQALLKPYSDAATGPNGSLTAQQNLLGLNGNGAQQDAINGIQNSAQFTSMQKLGENRILQNASATGGLRGGNTQAALAQFSPQLLAQLINDQYSKLGGITSIGQNAAAMTGNAGMQSANSVSGLLSQQGAANAGAALANGKADASMWNTIGSGIGTAAGAWGGFNSTVAPASTTSGFGGSGLGSGISGSLF